MHYGCNGKFLRVDLTRQSCQVESYDDDFRQLYLGGWGFIACFLLKELPPGIHPLGPQNMLIFANGTLSGNTVGGSGRSAVGAKSPLTGGFGEADVGGYFGAELARAGFDAILIQGRADAPCFLWLQDGQAELRPAQHLWGMQTAETQAAIQAELGDGRIRVAQIGPAGERLALIAAIMHDVNRAAARTGLGAVMGSKNLKAVAVRGRGKLTPQDPQRVTELARWYAKHYPNTWVKTLQYAGTAGGVASHQFVGGLPSLNWREGVFDGWETLTGDAMIETLLKERDTCFACPVSCKRVVEKLERQPALRADYGGPEYETVGSLGSMCGVADLEAVAYANQLCNAYGLDTISTGNTIAWAMDCFESGLLTLEDTGGVALRFGDSAAMLTMVELMGKREGFGETLSLGSRRAAQLIGRGSQEYTVEVKGQEPPMHEPRVKFGLGMGYAVSPTGADHNHNFHDSDYTTPGGVEALKPFGIHEPLPVDDLSRAKMELAAVEIPWALTSNLLGFCLFIHQSYDRPALVELLNAVTGWQMSLADVLVAGKRLYTLARLFNLREGFTRQDDRLPQVFFQPFERGPSAGMHLDEQQFEQALSDFYHCLGWDAQTGVPLAETLHTLGIGWAAELLPTLPGATNQEAS